MLIAAVALAAFLHTGLTTTLQFDREAIAAGQLWRLLTGHVTHWNFDHLAWDLGVFLLLGAMCEWRNGRALLACLAFSAIAVSLGVLALMPRMTIYRGLSGVDTGLFTLLGIWLLASACQRRQWRSAAVIGGLLAAAVGKIAFELATGSTLFVDDAAAGFIPLPLAHIVGGGVGVAVGLLSMTGETACSGHRHRVGGLFCERRYGTISCPCHPADRRSPKCGQMETFSRCGGFP